MKVNDNSYNNEGKKSPKINLMIFLREELHQIFK